MSTPVRFRCLFCPERFEQFTEYVRHVESAPEHLGPGLSLRVELTDRSYRIAAVPSRSSATAQQARDGPCQQCGGRGVHLSGGGWSATLCECGAGRNHQ